MKTKKIDIGMTKDQEYKLAQGLSALLADTYTLYLKTHNYHWNVTGHLFAVLHSMFESQYQDLAQAVDEIAERIRALGEYAPASYTQFAKLATIEEDTEVPQAQTMIQRLLDDHETIAKEVHSLIRQAEEAKDDATVELLSQRLKTHEKTAWMLRSSLE